MLASNLRVVALGQSLSKVLIAESCIASVQCPSLPPLVYPHPPTASTSAASEAAYAASERYRRTAYSGSVSQCVASPFKVASSPTRPERSRAVSLATSLGSWGPNYLRPTFTVCCLLSAIRKLFGRLDPLLRLE